MFIIKMPHLQNPSCVMITDIKGGILVGHFKPGQRGTASHPTSEPEADRSGQELSPVWCFTSADCCRQTVKVNVAERQSSSTGAAHLSAQHGPPLENHSKQRPRILTTMSEESPSSYFLVHLEAEILQGQFLCSSSSSRNLSVSSVNSPQSVYTAGTAATKLTIMRVKIRAAKLKRY